MISPCSVPAEDKGTLGARKLETSNKIFSG